jgi:tRNA-splicing ligase RtcB
MGSDMDEAPMAYKDIHTVMAAQNDLVEVLAKFEPRIVRMADAREKPEDFLFPAQLISKSFNGYMTMTS